MQRKNLCNTLKNFSTAALILAWACQSAAAARCEFSEQAPERYVVEVGDTLWDIASRFLKTPWCWPQVWDTNRDQIRNPHWIYPGQTIYFDRASGQITLTGDAINNRRSPALAHRLSPRMRTETVASLAATGPLSLSSFQAPVLVDEAALLKAPSIAAIKDGRKMAGKHDLIFVNGELGKLTEFMVLRGSEPIIDPQTQLTLARAGRRVGTVRLVQAGNRDAPHLFTVMTSDAELQAGDRLLPIPIAKSAAPLVGAPVNGQLASVLRGSLWASAHDVVAINRGRRHGLDAGSILAVTKRVIIDAYDKAMPAQIAPVGHIASLLVFEAEDSVALARVMYTSDILSVGDIVGAGNTEGR